MLKHELQQSHSAYDNGGAVHAERLSFCSSETMS